MNAKEVIAVDLALLPEDGVAQIAISANQGLLAETDGIIRLAEEASPSHGLPHLTLSMFFCTREQLGPALLACREAFLDAASVHASIDRVSGRNNSEGTTTWSYDVAATEELLQLHETCVALAQAHGTPRGDSAAFAGLPDDVREADVRWVTHYRREAALAHFAPHITLGFGNVTPADHAGPVCFDRIGAFHLGGGCTLRKILLLQDLD